MAKRNIEEKIQEDGTHGGKKRSKESIVALIICVLIAFAIWIYAKNAEIKDESGQIPTPANEQQTVSDDRVCTEG